MAFLSNKLWRDDKSVERKSIIPFPSVPAWQGKVPSEGTQCWNSEQIEKTR